MWGSRSSSGWEDVSLRGWGQCREIERLSRAGRLPEGEMTLLDAWPLMRSAWMPESPPVGVIVFLFRFLGLKALELWLHSYFQGECVNLKDTVHSECVIWNWESKHPSSSSPRPSAGLGSRQEEHSYKKWRPGIFWPQSAGLCSHSCQKPTEVLVLMVRSWMIFVCLFLLFLICFELGENFTSLYSFLFSKTKESKGIGYFHLNLREKTNVIPLTMAPETVLTMGCSELGSGGSSQSPEGWWGGGEQEARSPSHPPACLAPAETPPGLSQALEQPGARWVPPLWLSMVPPTQRSPAPCDPHSHAGAWWPEEPLKVRIQALPDLWPLHGSPWG